MAKFCGNCGAELTPDTKFCGKCGTPVANTSPVSLAKNETQTAPVAQPTFQPTQAPANPRGYSRVDYGWGPYVPDNGIMEKFFKTQGRLNRKPYWLRSLAMFLVMFVVILIATLIDENLGALVSIVAYIPCIAAGIMLGIRRLHDLNRSGWYILLNFVPVVNLALGIYIGFFKGTEGPNKYGPDPLASRW